MPELATLARPEGWLLAGVLGLGTLTSSSARRAPAAWLREGIAFVAVVVPHLTFRVLYYGDLVPNTFHAKVVGLSIDQGFTWLRAALDANHVLPYAGLALLGVVALLRDPARRLGAASCLAVLVLFVAYLVGIGGDYFEFRFLDPILPLWALWTTAGIAALLSLLGERSRVGRSVVASACVLVLSLNAGTIAYGFESRPGISSIERVATPRATWPSVSGFAPIFLRANRSPSGRRARSPT